MSLMRKLMLLSLPVFMLLTSFTVPKPVSTPEPTRCGSYLILENSTFIPSIIYVHVHDLVQGTAEAYDVPSPYNTDYEVPEILHPGSEHLYQFTFRVMLGLFDNETWELRLKNEAGFIVQRITFKRSTHGLQANLLVTMNVGCETYRAYVRKKSDP